MDTVLMELLGYLTEEMWLQSLESCAGNNSRERVKAYARQVYDFYPSLGWSDRTLKKLDLPIS